MTSVVTADQVQAVKPEFIWPIERPGQQNGAMAGRIVKGVQQFVAGKPDKGKGLVTVRIGADLAIAGYNVLHSAIEDPPGLMTKPRYVAAGCKGDALKRVHLKSFRFPVQRQEFEAYVIEHKIAVVILDPVASHLTNGINRFTDSIRQVTDPIKSFCEETGLTVIWVEHVNKNTKSDDPLSAVGGSGSGLVASCRAGYFLGIDPDTDGDRILAHVKGNMMEKPPAMRFEIDVVPVPVKSIDPDTGEVIEEEEDFPALLFTEECIFDPMRLVKPEKKDGKIGRPDNKKQAACEWLTNYLFKAYSDGLPKTADYQAVVQGQGVPAGRVFEDAKLAGMTEKTLRRAKTEMGVEIRPVGGGRNAKWNLPSEIVELLTGGDAPTPVAEAPQGVAGPAEQMAGISLPDAARSIAQMGNKVIPAKEPVLDPDSDEFDEQVAAWLAEESADSDTQSDEDGDL